MSTRQAMAWTVALVLVAGVAQAQQLDLSADAEDIRIGEEEYTP